MTSLRLVVGLGNPGAEYENTRHNIGFMTLDRMARGIADWKRERTWQAQVARWEGLILCKPETFMNLSGRALVAVARFYQIPTDSILVVLDEMALPLGRLRLRAGGSAAGHNGMKSVIEMTGTQDIARMRMGIGGAAPGDAVGHVLGRFRKDEWPSVEEMLARGEEAIRMVQRDGLPAAMNAFN
jgi:PTH1 family peptidyl-tRNA hydrolase